jgi:ankyrin repeat protein
MLFRTYEIKSDLLAKLNDPVECLFFHIKDNNYQKFKEILEKYKIPIDCKDPDGNTLLNLAVQCNAVKIADYLLSAGAEVNTQNVLIIKLNIIEKAKYTFAQRHNSQKFQHCRQFDSQARG